MITDPAPSARPERLLHVRVYGEPAGQGRISGGGMRQTKNGRMYAQPSYHSNREKLDPWRAAIIDAARAAMPGWGVTAPLDGALSLSAVFWMPRGKTVRREEPTVTPDLDHLLRALGDSLTKAGAIADDARITSLGRVSKRYADGEHPAGVAFYLETDPGGVADVELAA